MKLGEFQRLIEEWIPPATAWKGDNVGIQLGRTDTALRNILLALDVTLEVAREAVTRGANLIVTHHPLLFHPLRSLTQESRAGEIALFLAERKIGLYAAHTNLDHVRGGVSFAMAALLGLNNIRVLSPLGGQLVKIAVLVPVSHVEDVAGAMHRAGGGKFANYEQCSFRSEGVGTFRGTEASEPFIGSKGILEKTPETKLEMLVEKWNVRAAVKAMIQKHPYEEVAYDVVPLDNENAEYGLGAIGEYRKPISQDKFLSLVKKALGSPVLQYTGKSGSAVVSVALCGGAGYDAVQEAIRQGADAYITADVKYHGFQEAQRNIFLIDAGHYETERHILPILAARVRTIVEKQHSASKVFVTRKNTNPVSYF